ncbi:MAG: family 20 glycosylhydrolase [Bacteroidaceae bacterium]|nr:family 20 glycosylhydrolase [Bacteroidaceae bacterium]
MRKLISSIIATIIVATVYATDGLMPSVGSPFSIIPVPNKIEITKGTYKLPDNGATFYIKGEKDCTLGEYLRTSSLALQQANKAGSANILIEISNKKGENNREAYELHITPKRVSIKATDEAGAFYAIQTILQMSEGGAKRELQCCSLSDAPRFSYRGLLFDVSRHFRSKEFLMKQMDAMALMKLNKMHLHMTNGAGWRIEIERYPRLTEFAAWRPYRSWMDWADDTRYCESNYPTAYGGYYTKEDIKEILKYAEARHITVIPDIEMPGHSEEVLAAYPELSCSGEPYKNSDYCIGKEETFTFLENVLTEVMELFPSEYIHIGGDEAVKQGWKDCPHCKRRMQEEGLENVDELQSYLIHRIEKFVNSKGHKIIGWDEILEGGLAPNATVMSWRGTEGGIKAMKAGHDVIMTPGESCYLDFTQDAAFKEPVSIGGYTPLKKVYMYEPLEQNISAEEAKHLLGLQGNLWSEYITEDSHAEYMYYPRAFAIAETGWSRPENKDYENFRSRALGLCSLLQAQGYTTFDLANEFGERKESLQPIEHLGKGCKVSYKLPYNSKYSANGDATLTDGVLGGWTYLDKCWQGTMKDVDVTIDLGTVQPIKYVGASFMHSAGAWVHVPKKMDVYLSEDGEEFTLVGTVWGDIPNEIPKILFKQYSVVCNGKARYIRVHATRNDRPGAWLFTDEIVIN